MKELKVEPWNVDRHLLMFKEWHAEHGVAPDACTADLYPSTGFVVDDCAVAFLYKTNAPGVAYLDGLMTDPKVGKRRRHRAVVVLAKKLTELADEHGIRIVWCTSAVEGLENVLLNNGYRVFGFGFVCFVRNRGSN